MIESSKSISVVTFQRSAVHISELTGIGFLPSWVTGFFLTWNELSNQLEEKDGPEEREGGATRGKPLSRVLPLLSFTDLFNVFACCVFSVFPLGLNSNHRTLLTSAASAAGIAAAAADGAAADGAPPVWMLLVLVA